MIVRSILQLGLCFHRRGLFFAFFAAVLLDAVLAVVPAALRDFVGFVLAGAFRFLLVVVLDDGTEARACDLPLEVDVHVVFSAPLSPAGSMLSKFAALLFSP